MNVAWAPDELAYAGAEHRDPAYVVGYDTKAGFDVSPDIELLRQCAGDPSSTLVDLGAGTGILAAAAVPLFGRVVAVDPSPTMLAAAGARDAGLECVLAGFLSYEHAGEPPAAVYSRNALHHLPDVWKALALQRVSHTLKPGGTFVLRDIVYTCDPDELEGVLNAWFEAATTDPRDGWTRAELETHVRDEYSTFAWLLEPMLQRAHFEIQDVWVSDSRTYARYVCVKK